MKLYNTELNQNHKKDSAFVKHVKGLLIGDKGYIMSYKDRTKLAQVGVNLLAKERKNMDPYLNEYYENDLQKRKVIKTIFGYLKTRTSLLFAFARTAESFLVQVKAAVLTIFSESLNLMQQLINFTIRSNIHILYNYLISNMRTYSYQSLEKIPKLLSKGYRMKFGFYISTYLVTFFSIASPMLFVPMQKKFTDRMTAIITEKQNIILKPITQNKRNLACTYQIEMLKLIKDKQLKQASQKIRNNFLHHPSLEKIPKNIRNLYCNANTLEGLLSLLEKPGTYGFLLKTSNKPIGCIVMRFNFNDHQEPFLQVKRMHAFYQTNKDRFFGVGKTLLNLAATIAKYYGVNKLLATATFPIRSYFEHLGWKGEMIYTDYPLNKDVINLPQFKCSFDIPDNFESF